MEGSEGSEARWIVAVVLQVWQKHRILKAKLCGIESLNLVKKSVFFVVLDVCGTDAFAHSF